MPSESASILLVDDDPGVIASLALVLKQAGHRTTGALSPDEALAKLSTGKFDLVFQDMNFSRETSGSEGLALLRSIHAQQPRLPVVLITAWGSIELAVAGMRSGAADFITKPWNNQRVVEAVETTLSIARLPQDRDAITTRAQLESQGDIAAIIGTDPQLMRLLNVALRVAPTEAAVLITGEAGTGKELIAELIHKASRRAREPFVKVNLGGLSTSLFESEMFGHVKGAFTDARHDRKGRFEVASGGTIFLDEIGDLESACQVKLLRVLQDRSFEPLGSSQTKRVDVRVVSATNRDLTSMVASGAFREDLFYRLNLIALHLPPLRQRRDDIVLLAEHFLARLRPGSSLTSRAASWLQQQSWPGNVRELKATLERAALLADHSHLDVADLAANAAVPRPGHSAEAVPAIGAMRLDEMERAMIVKALRDHTGNITRVAQALGLTRAALYRRLKKFGLEG